MAFGETLANVVGLVSSLGVLSIRDARSLPGAEERRLVLADNATIPSVMLRCSRH
jgi:hypothetical protein